jgi:hypothetical protein
MEYRPQTYICAVQTLVVIAGTLILGAVVKGLDDMLTPDVVPDPLRYLRPLGRYGWILVLVPIAWVVLTIWGERSDLWWATNAFTVGSGLIILLGIVALFGWAGLSASSIVSGGR